MSKLSETSDLITLYLHHCGVSKVPPCYNLWSCISLISTCMGDRLVFRKFQDSNLTPSLFIILIGPSASGKGKAISTAMRFIDEMDAINLYEGKTTAPAFLDRLAVLGAQSLADGNIRPTTNMLLVTEELADNVGRGDRASDFVKMMTKLYTLAGSGRVVQEGTRMHGVKTLYRPTVNWLAGTTIEWFRQTVKPEDIQSGFFSRLVIERSEYGKNLHPDPWLPEDYHEVKEHIAERLVYLAQLHGVFSISPDAVALRHHWYVTRADDPPRNEWMRSWWERADDLLYKLAMVFSVSRGWSLQIEANDVDRAIRLISDLEGKMTELVETATQGEDSAVLEKVRRTLKKYPHGVQHSVLLSRLARGGILTKKMQDAIRHLIEENVCMSFDKTGRPTKYLPAYWYKYRFDTGLGDVELGDVD